MQNHNHINDYLKNKRNYINLRSQTGLLPVKTGGKDPYKWMKKLWGHTITVRTGRKKVIDKPNEKETFDVGKEESSHLSLRYLRTLIP